MTVEINKDSYWHNLSEWHSSKEGSISFIVFFTSDVPISHVSRWINIHNFRQQYTPPNWHSKMHDDTKSCTIIDFLLQLQSTRCATRDSTRLVVLQLEGIWEDMNCFVPNVISRNGSKKIKQGLLFAQPPVKKVNAFLLFFFASDEKDMWRVEGEWTSLI